jgi:integrase/recombinase XerD
MKIVFVPDGELKGINQKVQIRRQIWTILFDINRYNELSVMKSELKRRWFLMKWELSPDKFMSETEVKKLLKTSEDKMLADKAKGRRTFVRVHMFISIAIKSGLRVSELSNLKVSDFNLGKEPCLHVLGKGNKQRTVYISNSLKGDIKAYIRHFDLAESDYLLTSSHGNKYSTRALQKHFKNVSKLARLPEHYSVHSCRHSFGTQLYRKTKDLRLVQKMLGHSSVQTTAIYSHVCREDFLSAVNGVF